ncbi:MAG: DinB family protein [Propionibacteriales bacterium]|nr:DinB family protein [Propionibacteriales bacterium]
MYEPAVVTEIENVHHRLAEDLAALRAAAYGLTEEQARETPCRSALSIGGLLKHAIFVMTAWDVRAANPSGEVSQEHFRAHFGDFADSFALTDNESLAEMLTRFDASVEHYLGQVAEIDPNATVMEPPTPWTGRLEPTPASARYLLGHHVEELGRHAGHADIIREQLDGAQASSLQAAVEELPPNDFVQPWRPEQPSVTR